ncbi:Muscle LIM protein Mlp84B [Orchesella cincta]|uniref:Muscle LIM protein Mlp84B n=1 Tax=Orchesella cincta TaxID=48709 RepID=A0A1D2MX97_ORCCI|nr:Muscle LIM protein Mlp84B [Orchesella cincta]
MGKSKRNVSKHQSKIPKPPPLPPPPLRQTKSTPPPPPPLKSIKSVTGKEYSSQTNSTYQISEKNLPTNTNSKNLAAETESKSQIDRKLTSQKTIQAQASSRSKGKVDQQRTFVSKASWIPQQSQPLDDSNDSSSHDESLNQVYFFDEEECSDPDDEFLFTCCVPPYSPRYPPNLAQDAHGILQFCQLVLIYQRPLESHVNVATVIFLGQEVFLAELHLSSRGVYHTECYKCCLCGKSLDSWSVAEHKSELFCKGCYRRNFALHGCGFGVGAGVLQTP